MTVSTDGLVQWDPQAAGSFGVSVTVDDGKGGSATQSYSLNVQASGGQETHGLIGPGGGTLSLEDGTKLVVPPGALGSDVLTT